MKNLPDQGAGTQRPCCPILIPCLLLAAGCGRPADTPAATAPPPAEPLVLACPDPAVRTAVGGRAAGWAAQLGRPLRLVADGPADVRVVRPTDLGRLAVSGRLAPLPADFKTSAHRLQWPRLLPPLRGVVSGWGGETVAVPLAGEVLLVAYRADRLDDPAQKAAFQARFNRPLLPPATWDELADVATHFAAAGRPSLPGVPADDARLLAEFHAAAACSDRKALVDADLKGKEPPAGGFHFDPLTGKHRLTTAGFRAAADWLAAVAPLRGPDADPIAALTAGPAAVALVTLADVGRLPKGPDGVADRRVKLLPPPGSRTFADGDKTVKAGGRGGNYVPVLAAGGWVAAVDPARPDVATAWELVAEIAGPAASAARLSDPSAGGGPVRADTGSPAQWARYAFDPARNAELAAAVRQAVAVEVVNPAVDLRTPDAGPKRQALAAAVRLAAMGTRSGGAALHQAAAEWEKQDAAANPDDLRRWRRNAAGLP